MVLNGLPSHIWRPIFSLGYRKFSPASFFFQRLVQVHSHGDGLRASNSHNRGQVSMFKYFWSPHLLLFHYPVSHTDARRSWGPWLQQSTTIALNGNAGRGLLSLSHRLRTTEWYYFIPSPLQAMQWDCSFIPRILDNVICMVVFMNGHETLEVPIQKLVWPGMDTPEVWLVDMEPGLGTTKMPSKERVLIQTLGNIPKPPDSQSGLLLQICRLS